MFMTNSINQKTERKTSNKMLALYIETCKCFISEMLSSVETTDYIATIWTSMYNIFASIHAKWN